MMTRAVPVLMAFFWLTLGMVLIVAPWLDVWETNYFVYVYPALALVVKSSYVRGAVSGLGVLDVLMSFDAIRHWTSGVVTRS